ncbi:MAG: endonuclease/exonuclease/phosphatase family protein [Prevotellaceae bacterium]|jgi:endonuclease/exonuclease/phosphatase family metal-dependent hydrolase|nr:endonuclease/exonuclease/phosphatase family protein [Prevotellaceae bacterium]
MRHLYFLMLLSFAIFAGSEAAVGRSPEVKIMTFNIRFDNPADGVNSWSHRKLHAANCISFYEADIVGLQEALLHQLTDLTSYLPDYAYLGLGRDDGKEKGEFSAILYKRDRFEVLKSATFWLSEQPEKPGKKGWDAACPRVVTWALLKDKISGKELYIFNTHFDHVGKEARRESSKMLLSEVKKIAQDKNAVITGDFNATVDEEVIAILTDTKNPDKFVDSRQIAGLRYGPDYTWHNFGRDNSGRIIDFIFVKGKGIKVKKSGILVEKPENEVYLSDHNPVLCVLNIE